ncbi:MAG TPA: type I-MYXAN CRISPR-associated protein Cas6/Cmx6 [Gammaproteobacteria bacterium]|nr:type I-MYXAN CRISPR-associated protein Cas6/Cmx6 [Gammaproteobacteria bacterium]
MYWETDKDENTPYVVPDDVVDLVYHIRCRSLPLDHAHSLSTAIRERLPWMDEEELAGIHLIHGAESGNGWIRPEDASHEVLHLSRRARMSLRLPRHRIGDAAALGGQELDIDGHRLAIGESHVKLFSTLPTQFARYLVIPDGIDRDDEESFLAWVAERLQQLDIRPRKMLCGKAHAIHHPQGELRTRSLMLADLEVEEAVRLQQQGIGEHKKMGCGLFIPHKGIRAVHEMTADKQAG